MTNFLSMVFDELSQYDLVEIEIGSKIQETNLIRKLSNHKFNKSKIAVLFIGKCNNNILTLRYNLIIPNKINKITESKCKINIENFKNIDIKLNELTDSNLADSNLLIDLNLNLNLIGKESVELNESESKELKGSYELAELNNLKDLIDLENSEDSDNSDNSDNSEDSDSSCYDIFTYPMLYPYMQQTCVYISQSLDSYEKFYSIVINCYNNYIKSHPIDSNGFVLVEKHNENLIEVLRMYDRILTSSNCDIDKFPHESNKLYLRL